MFVSGIGCAARFPYYMNTYGLHSIHGRAPAVATGVALARPDLDVWVIGGDGDMLSIGGNHLIHALRRNVSLKIIMFNNQIYGLTKGQYSPTSEMGKITKSSPFGSLDTPFNPISVALAAEATFVARTHDMDRKRMTRGVPPRARAPGQRVRRDLPELQRLQRRRVRGDHRQGSRAPTCSSSCAHGEPIRFGTDNERGVVLNEFGECEIVEVADVGEDALLVHDETRDDPALAFALSRLSSSPTMPTPVGVFRSIQRPTYEAEVQRQLVGAAERRVPATSPSCIGTGATWDTSTSREPVPAQSSRLRNTMPGARLRARRTSSSPACGGRRPPRRGWCRPAPAAAGPRRRRRPSRPGRRRSRASLR